MKNSFVIFLIGTICFGLGYGVAQFTVENSTTAPQDEISQKEKGLSEDDLKQLFGQSFNQQNAQVTRPTSAQTSKINTLITEASDEKVNHYLKQAFPEADLTQIKNKRLFAQRALEEFSQTKNDERHDLVGQVIVAVEENAQVTAHALQNIHKSQYLYAHLDTLSRIENDQQVFIRWMNRDTGEVLFFTPQKVNSSTSQNWVSFAPAQGWKPGTYDVRYYQMGDGLKPIAQTSYVIQSIIE